MALTLKYAIITAVPDQRRGERVNVGIVVFLKERLDVRFPAIMKLRVLAGGDWEEYAQSVSRELASIYSPTQQPEDVLAGASVLERIIQFSDISWFSVSDATQYEDAVASIIDDLVKKPRITSDASRASRINTEIAKEFRKSKILASPDESIESHKVVRDYYVDTEEDLQADFVAKNGVYHVTATLDLRRESVHIMQATWKAIVLDRAKQVFADGTRRFGVYAAAPGATQFRPHIKLLGEYSDEVFNWADPSDRKAYTQRVYSALVPPAPLFSK